MRGERQSVSARGGDNKPIRGITVEPIGQSVQCDHDFRVQWKNLNQPRRTDFTQPTVKRLIGNKTAFLNQHLPFPGTDGGYAQCVPGSKLIQSLVISSGEPGCAG